MKQCIKNLIWKLVEATKLGRKIRQGLMMYPNYKNNGGRETKKNFVLNNLSDFDVVTASKKKSCQINELIRLSKYVPIENASGFFYSIDYYKTVQLKNRILDNYSIDYQYVVYGSLGIIRNNFNFKIVFFLMKRNM